LIVPLHAANPGALTGAGNWTYFLPGRHPLLVDAGVGDNAHLDALAQHAPGGPGHVVVTHAHGDHISGAAPLRARWPDTSFAKHLWPERDANYPVEWAALHDGDTIPAGDDELIVIHTPGHAPDHISLWQASSRTLFGGDLVVRGTTIFIPASMGGSLTQYLRSLERVLALMPERILPAHGPVIDDPETLVRQYIAHRREREEQVLAGLESGLRSVNELVDRIYVGLAPEFVPMARESVLAHLLKLQDENVVRRTGDDWYI
jgi:ribonuclease/clavin/mitogillin